MRSKYVLNKNNKNTNPDPRTQTQKLFKKKKKKKKLTKARKKKFSKKKQKNLQEKKIANLRNGTVRRIGQMRRQRAGVHGPSDSLSTSDRFLLSHPPLVRALSDARTQRRNLIHLPKRRRQLPRRHGRGRRLLLLRHRRRLT